MYFSYYVLYTSFLNESNLSALNFQGKEFSGVFTSRLDCRIASESLLSWRKKMPQTHFVWLSYHIWSLPSLGVCLPSLSSRIFRFITRPETAILGLRWLRGRPRKSVVTVATQLPRTMPYLCYCNRPPVHPPVFFMKFHSVVLRTRMDFSSLIATFKASGLRARISSGYELLFDQNHGESLRIFSRADLHPISVMTEREEDGIPTTDWMEGRQVKEPHPDSGGFFARMTSSLASTLNAIMPL